MNDITIASAPDAMNTMASRLKNPWLVAVWPGIGHVAVSAGYYLMSKLKMEALAEFAPRGLFEIDHVEVKDGLIYAGGLPRSRFFYWIDPNQHHDVVLFVGEAQPSEKLAFCHALVEFAKQLGVERIFTFAAMATPMHPEHPSRVFVAATDMGTLEELKDEDVRILEEGRITGLNGVVLGEAAAAGMRGACLLGEMPHIFSELPFPGASLAILKAFCSITGIALELSELEQQARIVSERLGELLSQVEDRLQSKLAPEMEEPSEFEATSEPQLSEKDRLRIEGMFAEARADKSKAYELKQELDRLGVFEDYEDQFLDLFQNPDSRD